MTSETIANRAVVRRIREWDAALSFEPVEFCGELTLLLPRERLLRVADFLRTDPELQFSFLSDISPVDRFPLDPRFEVNYHLMSMKLPDRVRLKILLPGDNPVAPSVTSVWRGANWHEREAFDLFGIQFSGHPDLRRLLMPDEWEGYPLRKDYPVEGYR
jgi:NADH-quinone oxidoreductase subunit C